MFFVVSQANVCQQESSLLRNSFLWHQPRNTFPIRASHCSETAAPAGELESPSYLVQKVTQVLFKVWAMGFATNLNIQSVVTSF